jgi:hypothetical protein
MLAGAVVVTNTGNRTCVLVGPPALARLIAGDTTLGQVVYQAKEGPGPGTSFMPAPMLLPPGEQRAAFLVWANWCEEMRPQVTTIEITLPGGTGKLDAEPASQPGVIGLGLGGLPRCDNPAAPSTLSIWAFALPSPA